jgi:probable HAF family extracellular repeat protein
MYNVHDIGTLGGGGCTAVAINAAGQVVGYSDLVDGTVHAFLYDSSGMHDLGTLGDGLHSFATAINPAGQVVGYSDGADGSRYHAFLYDSSGIHDLGTLGGRDSYATAIDPAGQVVGFSDLADGLSQHAFLYDSGGMHDLGTLGGSTAPNNSDARAINAAGAGRGSLRRSAWVFPRLPLQQRRDA